MKLDVSIFYQKFLEVVEEDVTDAILVILEVLFDFCWLQSYLCTSMGDFYPISLRNVAYKLLTKVISNRLKGFFQALFLRLSLPLLLEDLSQIILLLLLRCFMQ